MIMSGYFKIQYVWRRLPGRYTNVMRNEAYLQKSLWKRPFHTKVTKDSSGLPVVHHSKYVCDIPANHRFPMGKFPKILLFLLRDQIITDKQVWTPDLASEELLALVHTEEYVDKFIHGKTSPEEQKRTGFSWSDGLATRCRYETGGTVLAAGIALQRGLACSTAGGTHHAFPSYGAGFCLINDLAVAAKYWMEESSQKRKVLIVDLDVHQGDGTAYIFREEPDVFTFSMHCGSNFPVRKQQSDLDVSLKDGLEDKMYLATVQAYLPSILDSFRPDLVLYDAGVDPHWDDELGKLRLTDQGLYQRDLFVIDTTVSRGIPVAAVIGGGYCNDTDRLALRHSILHRVAAQVWKKRSL
uniref:Histone deacetylase 12 n=1 Tax=Paramormyrops kingsleyae TaxID=1676925 RepID=A0A3B3R8K5_9TELE|nr:uncharacterized protein LOC111851326 [Paramormyrops kingsleyae]